MLTAQDMSYDEARNLHSKWQKHQAFMAELASNKDWLDKIDKVWPVLLTVVTNFCLLGDISHNGDSYPGLSNLDNTD